MLCEMALTSRDVYGRASLVSSPAGRPDACQFMLVVDGLMNSGVFLACVASS
jgi:hypothetical protein